MREKTARRVAIQSYVNKQKKRRWITNRITVRLNYLMLMLVLRVLILRIQ